jgi:hypothetical protein
MLAIGWWMIAALLPLLFWFIADGYEDITRSIVAAPAA